MTIQGEQGVSSQISKRSENWSLAIVFQTFSLLSLLLSFPKRLKGKENFFNFSQFLLPIYGRTGCNLSLFFILFLLKGIQYQEYGILKSPPLYNR